jgi:hypothetical protein
MYAKFSVRRDTVHEPLRGVSIRSFVLSVGFYRNPRFAGASESPGDEKVKPGSAATAFLCGSRAGAALPGGRITMSAPTPRARRAVSSSVP